MKARQQPPKLKPWYLWILIGILVIGGAAYTLWNPAIFSKTAAQPTQAFQITVVRKGNLGNSISGTGTLAASKSSDLSFPVTGTVATLNVQVGDQVKAGQVLASLDNTENLQLAVKNSQLALQTAQQTLDTYTSGADANLAQAYSTLAAAEKALATAQANVHQKGDPRCDPALTQQYYSEYLDAQTQARKWEPYLYDHKGGYGTDYLLQILNPLWQKENLAFINYTYCQGYTDQEITASQANLQTAKANLDSAQTSYQNLSANKGLDPTTVAIDQAAVKNAQVQLTKAQNDLAGATLVSPIDGTITAVNGSVGTSTTGTGSATTTPAGNGNTPTTTPGNGSAATTAFISVADLNNPVLDINIDETDLSNIAVGCPVQAQFNSVPAKTFPGTVTQILPVLASSNNVTSAQGVVTLKDITQALGKTLPLGTQASVVVTCNQATNVLQVPIQALHEVTGQPPYVYVLNAQGKPEKRTVSIGLRTSAFAEIRSGLSEGEQVITSQVKAQ
jgi:HlyD family secretion protein